MLMSTLVRYNYLEGKEGNNSLAYFISSIIELAIVYLFIYYYYVNSI